MTDLRLAYQTIEFGKIDIHICTLRNRQEFYDPEGVAEELGISSAAWPIFGVIWPSSLVLANTLLESNTESKRILEVGCGMAVSSLLLNKLKRDITATDYHPEAELFLKRNAQLNDDNIIPFEQVNWASENDNLGRFDMIIGSDILYEDEHIDLLSSFIENHANPACEVILVDPGRGRKNKLRSKMEACGFTADFFQPEITDYLNEPFKGYVLRFVR